MVNSRNKKKEIGAILKLGYRVLEIEESDNSSTFYDVNQFESSVFSTTSSLDFNNLQGKDITEFLQNTNILINDVHLKSAYDAYLEREVKIKMDFSNTFKWKMYTLY